MGLEWVMKVGHRCGTGVGQEGRSQVFWLEWVMKVGHRCSGWSGS